MLKKLLPKLNLNLNPKPKSDPGASQVVSQDSSVNTPNLLDSYEPDFMHNYNFLYKAVNSLKLFIIFVPALFFISLFLNDLTDFRISAAKKNIDRLNTEITKYDKVGREANLVIKKTELYKQVKASYPDISKRVEWLMTQVPTDTVLEEIRYDKDDGSVEVKAVTSKALNIALLIDRYFKDDSISEVILESTEFDSRTQSYSSTIEVVYE
ncbi:MAG TPA: hypothetical protein VJG85_01820 [Patescibacteria group bacterium]|nr:hypothetical protein [Patescibacteria group bacterium]